MSRWYCHNTQVHFIIDLYSAMSHDVIVSGAAVLINRNSILLYLFFALLIVDRCSKFHNKDILMHHRERYFI